MTNVCQKYQCYLRLSKIFCRYKDCPCGPCRLIVERRRIMSQQGQLRREEEAKGNPHQDLYQSKGEVPPKKRNSVLQSVAKHACGKRGKIAENEPVEWVWKVTGSLNAPKEEAEVLLTCRCASHATRNYQNRGWCQCYTRAKDCVKSITRSERAVPRQNQPRTRTQVFERMDSIFWKPESARQGLRRGTEMRRSMEFGTFDWF